MTHQENHEHAFIDSSNTVINVAVFDGHDHELIQIIQNAHTGAVATICCCDNGIASVGYTWNGSRFLTPDGELAPLTRQPIDANYEWVESEKRWNKIGEHIIL